MFSEHCNQKGEYYNEDKFYKIPRWDVELYERLLGDYKKWRKLYLENFYELAKALNWFADIVRRDINPFFFSKEGRFAIVEGDILGYFPHIYQFTEQEKSQMPKRLLDKFDVIT